MDATQQRPSNKVPSPRPNGSMLFRIPKRVYDYDDERDMDLDLSPEISARVIAYLKEKGHIIQYGDVILFKSSSQYRNEGRRIWTGDQFVCYDSLIDEYGHLPAQFPVITNGYPANYWSKNVDHNAIVPLDLQPIRSQLVTHYTCVGKVMSTWFKWKDEKYAIINYDAVDWESEVPDDDDTHYGYFTTGMNERFFLDTIQSAATGHFELDENNSTLLHMCIPLHYHQDNDESNDDAMDVRHMIYLGNDVLPCLDPEDEESN